MFTNTIVSLICGLSTVVGAPQVADTLVLSLGDARRMAVEANPELLAAAEWPRMAAGDVRAARALRYNPEMTFESRSPGAGFASSYEAALGLELEVAGQAGLRTGAAEASYASSVARFDNEARSILAQVGHAYAALAAAEERAARVGEIGRLNADLSAAVSARLDEGEVSVLEANLVNIEAARARARAAEMSSEAFAAAISLGRLLGLPAGTSIRTTGPAAEFALGTTQDVESLVALALSNRPDLIAQTSEVQRARYSARLVRREVLPNIRVAGLATREGPSRDPRLGLAFGISLPLFNRGQGVGDRFQAELAEAERRREAAALRVRSDVEDAFQRSASATKEVAILEAGLLGQVRENQALLEVSYLEGVIDLPTVLLLRNQLLDAELVYWDAWERRQRARIDLESATGQILDGIQLTPRRAQ